MRRGRIEAWMWLLFFCLLGTSTQSQTQPRARDLGVPFDGTPGPLNAITDVKGVEVGHTTLISGEGALKVGVGPVRTGVTAILPRGKTNITDKVFASWFTLNGAGELTGSAWIDDSGFLDGPVMITNTHSVGVVHDAVIAWRVNHGPPDADGYWWSTPVVSETDDSDLNDMNGFHVKPQDVFHAIDSAASGPVPEGNVGGGTGDTCFEFKGGIGTASRRLDAKAGGYTVGVLLTCNYGARQQLRIAGVPVGREISASKPKAEDEGSIVIVVATDAPLLPHQLRRLAKRVSLGLGRTGGYSGEQSGDMFVAFSTANPGASGSSGLRNLIMLPNSGLNDLFLATVQATEEALANALIAARTMAGVNNYTVEALPHERLREVLKKYNRLAK